MLGRNFWEKGEVLAKEGYRLDNFNIGDRINNNRYCGISTIYINFNKKISVNISCSGMFFCYSEKRFSELYVGQEDK